MEWFEEWFDSPLYEKLYANRDDAEAKILADHLQKIIPANKYSNILDLGCGRGRHSINMALRGYHVTGVDLSETAINMARARSEKLGLDIEFVIGDMRKPLKRKFDAIINLFTSFGYFEDEKENELILKAMSEMLHYESILIIDYMNAQYVMKHYVAHEKGKIGDVSYEITRFIEDDTINKKMIFQLDGDGSAKKKIFTERVKLYTSDWFEHKLSENKILITRIYGDYEFHTFDPLKSPRMILLGKVN